jgi:phosphoketolase
MSQITVAQPQTETSSRGPLSPELLDKMNAYWRAANYLSVGQIYLINRSQVMLDAILRVARLAPQHDAARQWYSEQIQRHKLYVAECGEDLPEIRNWRWPADRA